MESVISENAAYANQLRGFDFLKIGSNVWRLLEYRGKVFDNLIEVEHHNQYLDEEKINTDEAYALIRNINEQIKVLMCL